MGYENLTLNWKNGWSRIDDAIRPAMDAMTKEYLRFLDDAKTEREAVRIAIDLAKKNGFVDIATLKSWTPGAKVYMENRGKAVVFAVLGKTPAVEGVNMVAAHVDAPRLDLKPRALREDEEFGVFETHYYGGIKKFQWLSLPLSLHGVVVKKDGTVVDVVVGEKEDDPVFVIPDVLPHLGAKVQMSKTVADAFPGESLDVLVASVPLKGEEKESVKKHVLKLLNERYGIVEEDFISAELEVVPVQKAREVGFDRGLLGGYGQDDRVCGFTALKAIIDLENVPDRTAVAVLADKEEIGSVGNTGMEAAYIDMFIEHLLHLSNGSFSPLDARKAWNRTKVLSADVTAGVDPIWKSVHEMTNAARMGYGPALAKYTGRGGKGGSNDAHPEFIAELRRIFDEEGIIWQVAELGKVDEGGGGTVALYLANRGADVVDIGTAILGMHSPFEISSKLDVFFMYKSAHAFFRKAR